jgi:hypothetical protein
MEGHTHLGVGANTWDKIGIIIAYVILVICVVKRLMQFWAEAKENNSKFREDINKNKEDQKEDPLDLNTG